MVVDKKTRLWLWILIIVVIIIIGVVVYFLFFSGATPPVNTNGIPSGIPKPPPLPE